jgi:hypothetical protein
MWRQTGSAAPCDPASAAATNRVAGLMSDVVELLEVPDDMAVLARRGQRFRLATAAARRRFMARRVSRRGAPRSRGARPVVSAGRTLQQGR